MSVVVFRVAIVYLTILSGFDTMAAGGGIYRSPTTTGNVRVSLEDPYSSYGLDTSGKWAQGTMNFPYVTFCPERSDGLVHAQNYGGKKDTLVLKFTAGKYGGFQGLKSGQNVQVHLHKGHVDIYKTKDKRGRWWPTVIFGALSEGHVYSNQDVILVKGGQNGTISPAEDSKGYSTAKIRVTLQGNKTEYYLGFRRGEIVKAQVTWPVVPDE